MSDSINNNGGPAFPVTLDHRGAVGAYGMSLRDWFAGQERIEQEEIAWEVCESFAGPRPSGDYKANAVEWFNWSNRWQAAVRYARADAMIAARKGGSK